MCALLSVLFLGVYIISLFSLYTVSVIVGLQYSKPSYELGAFSYLLKYFLNLEYLSA